MQRSTTFKQPNAYQLRGKVQFNKWKINLEQLKTLIYILLNKAITNFNTYEYKQLSFVILEKNGLLLMNLHIYQTNYNDKLKDKSSHTKRYKNIHTQWQINRGTTVLELLSSSTFTTKLFFFPNLHFLLLLTDPHVYLDDPHTYFL